MAKTRIDSEFDAQKFLDEVNKEREKEMKASSGIPAGAVAGDPWDEPPAPNMHHDPCLWMWVPETPKEKQSEWNPDTVPNIKRPGYSITGKKLPDDAELTNQSAIQSVEQSPKSDSGQATIMTKVEDTPQSGITKSEEPPASQPQPKVTPALKKTAVAKSKEEPKTPDNPIPVTKKKTDTLTDVNIVTDVTVMTSTDMAVTQPDDANVTPVSPKATRISAKMRRASRKEFHDTYLVKTDTKGGKPITIAPDIVERAYRICARSGDYRTCPTYLFNNLLREAIDAIEPDTESWADLG